MITILLIWAYIFVVTSVAGFILKALFFKNKDNSVFKDPVLLSVAGYCVITFIAGVISIFYKISWEANLFIVIAECIGCFLMKKEFLLFFKTIKERCKKVKPIQIVVALFVIFIILLMNIKSVQYDSDPGLYHAQAIQWIEKYPCIPGLGNLFANLAFNSSSFLTSALFSFTFIYNFPYHVVNSFMVLLLIIFALKSIKYNDNNFIIYSGLIILCFYNLRGDMSLPYPDISVAVMIIFTFLLYLDKIKRDNLREFDFHSFIIVLLSFTAVTNKLSALPLVLVIGLLLIYSWKSTTKSHLLLIAFSGFLIMSPWLIRNIILSGYLIFPYPQLDLFNVDWKVPFSEAMVAKSWIVSYARLIKLQDDYHLMFNEWFPIWRNNQDSSTLVFLLFAVFGTVLLSVFSMLSKSLKRKADMPLIAFGTIFLMAIIYWFFTAPAFRFGYAYIFVCDVIIIAVLLRIFNVNNQLLKIVSMALILLFGVYCCSWPVKLIISGEVNLKQHLLYPEIKYKPIQCVEKRINGLTILMPIDNMRCWNEPAPCTPRLFTGLQPRGNDLSSGFRIVEPDSLIKSY